LPFVKDINLISATEFSISIYLRLLAEYYYPSAVRYIAEETTAYPHRLLPNPIPRCAQILPRKV